MAESSTLMIALFLAGSTSGVILLRALVSVIRGQYLDDRDSEA